MKKYGILLTVLAAIFTLAFSACASTPAIEDPVQTENPLLKYSVDKPLTSREVRTWPVILRQQISQDMGFILLEREDGARAMLLVYLPKNFCVGYTYALNGKLVIMEVNKDGVYQDITNFMAQNDPEMIGVLTRVLTLPVPMGQ